MKPGERGIGCIRGMAPLSVMWSDVDLPSLFLLGTNGFFFVFAILNNYAQVEQTKRNHGECGICVEI